MSIIGARARVFGFTHWKCRRCKETARSPIPTVAADCISCLGRTGKHIPMVPVKANKYRAKRQPALFPGGRSYDSTAERDYRQYLDLLVKAGLVRDIMEQPRVFLSRAEIPYKPDFVFDEVDSHTGLLVQGRVYVDVKGVETSEFRIKVKLWAVYGPSVLRIVKRGGKRQPWTVVREIIPQREESP